MSNNNLMGIGLFQMQILHLISIGKQESISEIEGHFENKDLVEYLYSKYKDDFFIEFNDRTYSNKALNQYFYNYSSYIANNESRKYGIQNENDGLLLILSLIADKIERASEKWTVDFE